MKISERPQWYCRNCGAKARWDILKRVLLVSVIIVILGSCNGPSTNHDAASDNGSGTTSDEEQRTTVSQPADTEEDDTEETTVFSSSLTVTTTNTEEAEDLTFVDTDGDGSSDYRAYLRYDNYLERGDMSSVYIEVAVLSSYTRYDLAMYDDEQTSLAAYGDELMSDVLERLPHYDFVLLSVYADDTGEYEGPVTYTDNAEVADAYKGHLHEYADELANAAMEGESPTEIQHAEDEYREVIIPIYDYQDSRRILANPDAPHIPPRAYSDREAQILGEPPGLEGMIDSTITDHYEAIRAGNFEEAYSYFSSDYRSTTDMNSWIEEQESNKVDTIHGPGAEVEVTSQDTATATIRVSFEDSIHQCDNIYLCTNPSNITWEMVKEGEEWKLDEILSVEVEEMGRRIN